MAGDRVLGLASTASNPRETLRAVLGGAMRHIIIASTCVCGVIVGTLYVKPALAQAATVPVRPSDRPIPPDVVYPDAVTCNVTSHAGITYRMIFYKSQTISFGTEPNNEAEYGTTFDQPPDTNGSATSYKWRLQLGKPGNITMFTLPAGWTTSNCAVGKSIADLIADKQALKIFTPQ